MLSCSNYIGPFPKGPPILYTKVVVETWGLCKGNCLLYYLAVNLIKMKAVFGDRVSSLGRWPLNESIAVFLNTQCT